MGSTGSHILFRARESLSGAIVNSANPPAGYAPVTAAATDNSAAIQALLDARLGPVVLPPGVIDIQDTIYMTYSQAAGEGSARSGATLVGAGKTDQSAQLHTGTILRWTGAEDGDMIRIGGNCCYIADMYFLGDSTESGSTEAGNAIRILGAGFEDQGAGLATGRCYFEHLHFRNIKKGINCDCLKNYYDQDSEGETVEKVGTTVTISGSGTWPTTIAQNRDSGNPFPTSIITINGTDYTVTARTSTTLTTAESGDEAAGSDFIVTWYNEVNSASITCSDISVRDVDDFFYSDNSQAFGFDFHTIRIYNGTGTTTLFNIQGGGGLHVYGGYCSADTVTLLKLGEGVGTGQGSFNFSGFIYDGQANPHILLDDDASTDTFISFEDFHFSSSFDGDLDINVDRSVGENGANVFLNRIRVDLPASPDGLNLNLNGAAGKPIDVFMRDVNTYYLGSDNRGAITGSNYRVLVDRPGSRFNLGRHFISG